MDNQQTNSGIPQYGNGTIILMFIVQILCTLYVFASYGLSNFGGGEQYLPSQAILPILIVFLTLAFSIKLYIGFRHGKNIYKKSGLILSIIPPILILMMLI